MESFVIFMSLSSICVALIVFRRHKELVSVCREREGL